jgi:hypothetical protein
MNSVIMWQTISRLFFFILITSCDSDLAQDTPQTPEPNSPERRAIMNSLRVPVEKELKQKVVFRIRRLNVQNGWAFLDGVPQQPGGKPVNYTVTRHQTAIEAGAFDDGILALLRTEKGGMASRRLRDRFDRLSGGVLAAEIESAARHLPVSGNGDWRIS